MFHVRQVTALVTANLNKIIDVNYYPVETAKRSNLRHRPIGLGVQGLADTFILLGMPFDSPEVIHLPSNFCCLTGSAGADLVYCLCTGSTTKQRHI